MNVNDSVALVVDREFRDIHYQARQYGRVLEINERNAHGSYGPFAYVDWSDIGSGATPDKPETVHVGNLRVVYPAPVCLDTYA